MVARWLLVGHPRLHPNIVTCELCAHSKCTKSLRPEGEGWRGQLPLPSIGQLYRKSSTPLNPKQESLSVSLPCLPCAPHPQCSHVSLGGLTPLLGVARGSTFVFTHCPLHWVNQVYVTLPQPPRQSLVL